jgi:hypothetical protein
MTQEEVAIGEKAQRPECFSGLHEQIDTAEAAGFYIAIGKGV